MTGQSTVNTSKGKMALTVATIVSLLMINMDVNVNSWNTNAFDQKKFSYEDDIGQSIECVKVVVGCDGQGTIGSSRDVIIGSSDDNNTKGNDTPIGPIDQSLCESCFDKLSNSQREALVTGVDVASIAEFCLSVEDLTPEMLLELLLSIDVDLFVALDILDCLGIT